jgi:hypothetical protein
MDSRLRGGETTRRGWSAAVGGGSNGQDHLDPPMGRCEGVTMVVLGLILLILGLVTGMSILVTIGLILLVVGLVLNFVPIGGTRRRYY